MAATSPSLARPPTPAADDGRSQLAFAAAWATHAARLGAGSWDAVAAALASGFRLADPATGRHSESVSTLVALVAHELGLGADRVGDLRRAGLVHDIGKLAIRGELLRKPAALDRPERTELDEHPQLGEAILRLAGLEREARWTRHHHERIDGRGYPDGLRGGEIPLESRVIMVADAFDAMTAARPYRAGRPAGEALAELGRHAGEQLDRDCLAALAAVIDGGGPSGRGSRFTLVV